MDFSAYTKNLPTPVEPNENIPRKGKPVGPSPDLTRILALPRRKVPTAAELQVVCEGIERYLGKGDVQCECVSKYRRRCCKHIKPVQAWALMELSQMGGLFGPIGVGHGKTLLNLLGPMVVPNCKTAVLLVKPDLRDQLLTIDWQFYAQHWHLPDYATSTMLTVGRPRLHVVAYSQLSGTKSSRLLDEIQPDLILADEAHTVARRKDTRSARATRLKRYLDAHPDTRFACWSGTLTKRSIADYAEFSSWALRDGSPVPQHWPTVLEWAESVDPSSWRAPFGHLERFGSPVLESMLQHRLETRGVVTSGDNDSCQAELNIKKRDVQVPAAISQLLAQVDATWERPDGELLTEAIDVADCQRELSAGFYYRWTWPRGETKPVIDNWLEARKLYGQELREKLKRPRPDMDSPALLWAAAHRWHYGYSYEDEQGKRHNEPPKSKKGPKPVWECESFLRWEATEPTAKPSTEAVWVSDFLLQDAAAWLQEQVGIVWYLHTAWGEALEKLTRLSRYGAGPEASAGIVRESGQQSIIASIKAHGTGKNLQMFRSNLVANPPSAGDVWEQLLGRTHRDGQLADEVDVWVYKHTESYRAALDKARDLALYIEGAFGAPQKLVDKANWSF